MNIKITTPDNHSNEVNLIISEILKPENANKLNNGGIWVFGDLRAKTSKRKNSISINIFLKTEQI